MTIFDKLIREWRERAERHRICQREILIEEPEEACMHDLEASVLEGCIIDLQVALTPPAPQQPDIKF